jgi:anti-anti-sigma factor
LHLPTCPVTPSASARCSPAPGRPRPPAPTLDADLRALRDVGFETIVLDLRRLDFIDSAGVHLLVRWARSAALRGHEFRIMPGADRIQLVLRLTGVLASLGLEGPRRAA